MNTKHLCPNCGSEMTEIYNNDMKDLKESRVWDQGITGRMSTSGNPVVTASKVGIGTTSGHGPRQEYNETIHEGHMAVSPPYRSVMLIPYQCPGCGHQESYRE